MVLQDWDAEHGPTNADVAKGIGGIWAVSMLATVFQHAALRILS